MRFIRLVDKTLRKPYQVTQDAGHSSNWNFYQVTQDASTVVIGILAAI